MRKHLYLITGHRDEDKIGLVEIADSQRPTVTKNEEGVIRKRNLETDETHCVNAVGMGYADFEDQADYEDRIGDVIEDKLQDLDAEHLEKAGATDFLEARA